MFAPRDLVAKPWTTRARGARLAAAIFQWNVATIRVGRATGEFTAQTGRRKEP